MFLHEKEIQLPAVADHNGLLTYFEKEILNSIPRNDIPVRFAITRTDNNGYHCELGILSDVGHHNAPENNDLFKFRKRKYEDADNFNAVLLIPTGIGAEIGGHSGDGGAVARLVASACDTLITHPNVVNAADINELPENGLYVEGSVITRLLMGVIGLQKVRSNRVALIMDEHSDEFFHEAAINSVSAARASMGLDCPMVYKMKDTITMQSMYSSSGRAVGKISNLERVCKIIEDSRDKFDAVAFSTIIRVPRNFHTDYFKEDIVNPWGGVEAMLTHAVSMLFDIPSAHSPMMESREILDLNVGVVDPRKSAEAVSVTYLHSVLKGLYKSPRIINNISDASFHNLLTVEDVSCLIIPYGVLGLPTLAALEQEIPVIAVRDNKNRMENNLEEFPFNYGQLHIVDNYLEAVGVMHAIKSGVSIDSTRRPIESTNVVTSDSNLKSNYSSSEKRIDLQEASQIISRNY